MANLEAVLGGQQQNRWTHWVNYEKSIKRREGGREEGGGGSLFPFDLFLLHPLKMRGNELCLRFTARALVPVGFRVQNFPVETHARAHATNSSPLRSFLRQRDTCLVSRPQKTSRLQVNERTSHRSLCTRTGQIGFSPWSYRVNTIWNQIFSKIISSSPRTWACAHALLKQVVIVSN